jgi:general secretion pathway protein A
MNYYNILNFKKEPFSNSPEPEFLFQLPQYSDCLQKLELAVRLRRGINVVIGDIGTGKTTLCRKLIQNFSSTSADSVETEIATHLLLDPAFNSAAEFLHTVALMLGIKDLNEDFKSEWHLKERIKDYLFEKGVDEKRIVVLIIDEGQKIPENCLEILREFLNYETNKFKLLQIIIFAQREFQTVLEKKPNLLDRVNLLFHLRPLNFSQMKAMINYRLSVARDFEKSPSLFSLGGFVAIYIATGGYPRKVVFLCHQVVLKMIIRGKKKAGWFLVRSCRSEMKSPLYRKLGWALAGLLLIIIVGISVSAISLQSINLDTNKKLKVIFANLDIPEVENNKVRDVKMPDYIGKISMTKRRTIWWTLNNIYGDTSPQIMGEIFKVNPFLENNNKIMIGTKITLPSIPADNKPIKQGDIVVALESGQDLEKMYNIFRNNPDEPKLPRLAFLSFWNKKNGLEFVVVIDRKFKDIKSAEEATGKLPPEIAAKAKIISQWDADTVFFNRRASQY